MTNTNILISYIGLSLYLKYYKSEKHYKLWHIMYVNKFLLCNLQLHSVKNLRALVIIDDFNSG